jgi:hypothetical protein
MKRLSKLDLTMYEKISRDVKYAGDTCFGSFVIFVDKQYIFLDCNK